jgi:hypothetical protein
MRDDKPLVSVIIPFLNAEAFMQETIDLACGKTPLGGLNTGRSRPLGTVSTEL